MLEDKHACTTSPQRDHKVSGFLFQCCEYSKSTKAAAPIWVEGLLKWGYILSSVHPSVGHSSGGQPKGLECQLEGSGN